jgi:hypothetical protein
MGTPAEGIFPLGHAQNLYEALVQANAFVKSPLSGCAEENGTIAFDLSHLKALLENIPLRVLASRKDVVGHAQ